MSPDMFHGKVCLTGFAEWVLGLQMRHRSSLIGSFLKGSL